MDNSLPSVQEAPVVKTNVKSKTEKPLSKEGAGKFAIEKAMIGLALIFILGTIALTFIPAPYNGAVMGLITLLTFVVLFGF